MAEFAGLPKRKLDDLAARGWQVCGAAIEKEGQYGAITYGGRVLWWVDRGHGISESPFDYDTAKRLLACESVGEDQLKAFVANARWSNDDVNLLRGDLLQAHLTLAQRDAEIELLKSALLDAEADTARIDWIGQQGDEFSACLLVDMPGDGDIRVYGMNASGQGKTLRDAIDAAKSA